MTAKTFAILSDVHANLEALTAVLERADALGADRVVCLGDLVGYFSDPDACVELLRARGAIMIAGNHDRVASGLEKPTTFGRRGREAILWTRANISRRTRSYLAELPSHHVERDAFVAVHAALHPEPNHQTYLRRRCDIADSLDALASRGEHVAFFGHTHWPVIHARRGKDPSMRAPVALPADDHFLVNPGSVGQPRDGDERASFALYRPTSRLLELHRVEFDRDKTLAKARRAGLPTGEGIARRSFALARSVIRAFAHRAA